MRAQLIQRTVSLLATCLLIVACEVPDRSPEDTVKAYEDAISHGSPTDARALLTDKQAKDAPQLFLNVLAEAHNRGEEGVLSEKRSTKTTGESATVTAVFQMRGKVRRTYEWDLVREKDRWRIDAWGVEVAAGPAIE